MSICRFRKLRLLRWKSHFDGIDLAWLDGHASWLDSDVWDEEPYERPLPWPLSWCEIQLWHPLWK